MSEAVLSKRRSSRRLRKDETAPMETEAQEKQVSEEPVMEEKKEEIKEEKEVKADELGTTKELIQQLVGEPSPASKANLITPSRRVPGTPSQQGIPKSPARITREEERQQLADLNKRLEQYIVHQRERDASASGKDREIDLIREKYETEAINSKKIFDAQIELVRKNRDEALAQLAAANDEKASREGLLQQLNNELAALKKFKAEMEEKAKQLSKDLTDTQAGRLSAEDENKKLHHDLDVETQRTETLSHEVAEQRERAERANGSLTAAESKATSLAEDLALERRKAADEIARLEAQVTELQRINARKEEDIRAEFHKQMTDALAERQAQYEEEKADGLAQLKAVYDEKMAAFREELETAGHELEQEKLNTKNIKAKIAAADARCQALAAERDQLAATIKELEQALQNEKDKPQKGLAEKNEIIRRIKEAFKRKNIEFDELMDVKIALAMEIKAFRRLLDNEEERIGYKSPLKKRKRDAVALESSSSSSAQEVPATPQATPAAAEAKEEKVQDTTSSLLISGMDLEGQYITIRNGSTETVPLKGWSLQAKKTHRRFEFPVDAKLRPGDSFTVHTVDSGALNSKEGKFTSTEAWCTTDVWDPQGDEAMLVDPSELVMARVEVIPQAALKTPPRTETLSAVSESTSSASSMSALSIPAASSSESAPAAESTSAPVQEGKAEENNVKEESKPAVEGDKPKEDAAMSDVAPAAPATEAPAPAEGAAPVPASTEAATSSEGAPAAAAAPVDPNDPTKRRESCLIM